MPVETRDLLPIGEAARYVGVSVPTLRRWDDEGQIKAIRTFGNQRRFRVEDLDNLVAGRTPTPAGDAA
jgi:excisionase family DNA binding protein